jgi:hypothetical protein
MNMFTKTRLYQIYTLQQQQPTGAISMGGLRPTVLILNQMLIIRRLGSRITALLRSWP